MTVKRNSSVPFRLYPKQPSHILRVFIRLNRITQTVPTLISLISHYFTFRVVSLDTNVNLCGKMDTVSVSSVVRGQSVGVDTNPVDIPFPTRDIVTNRILTNRVHRPYMVTVIHYMSWVPYLTCHKIPGSRKKGLFLYGEITVLTLSVSLP